MGTLHQSFLTLGPRLSEKPPFQMLLNTVKEKKVLEALTWTVKCFRSEVMQVTFINHILPELDLWLHPATVFCVPGRGRKQGT